MTEESTSDVPTTAAAELIDTSADSLLCRHYSDFLLLPICTTLFLFGVTGNLMTLSGLIKDAKKSASFYLLCATVIIDILLLLFIFFVISVVRFTKMAGELFWSTVILYVGYFYIEGIIGALQMIRVWLTIWVSVQRFVGIQFPHSAKAWGRIWVAKVKIGVTCSVCFLYQIPNVLRMGMRVQNGRMFFFNILENDISLGFSAVSNILRYTIPILVMVVFSVLLIVGLKKMKSSAKITQVQVTMVTVVLIVIEILCQLLIPLRTMISALHSDDMTCGSFLFFYDPFIPIILTLSSASDVIIYALILPRFRQRLRGLFGGTRVEPSANSGPTP
uniref:G-protein coupled receptors family 1 profile domain-containing protein n=1 Tax=Capitella teleta TaxID=283909 RepID=X2A913_CAPTE